MNQLWFDAAFQDRLIPSQTIREYVRETRWEPKDDLALSILINHMDISLREKEEYLTRIARESDDQALRDYIIGETLHYRQKALELFDEPGDCVYRVKLSCGENGDATFGYYPTCDRALADAKRLGHPFSIMKYPLERRRFFDAFISGGAQGPVCDSSNTPLEVGALGGVDYDAAGEAVNVWLTIDAIAPQTPGKDVSWLLREPRFRDAHVALPNPFYQGDIVAVLDKQGKHVRYGIVWSTKSGWEEAHKGDAYRGCNYNEEVLLVEVIDDATGEFVCWNVNPLYLECPKMIEDKTTRGYLVSARLMMLGQGWFDDFFQMHRAYCKAYVENWREEAAPVKFVKWV